MESSQTPHTPAPRPPAAADAASKPYFDEAWALICTGERPSADKLVARLGGSKSIAVSALRTFWATELPARMQAQHVIAPTPIHALAAQIWTEAQLLARKDADAALASAHAALVTDRAALETQRQAFAGREQEHAAQLAAANAHAARLAGAERELRSRLEAQETTLNELREQRDRLTRTADSLQALLGATQEKHDAQRTQLEARLDTLAGALQRAEGQATAAHQALATAQALAARVPAVEHEIQAARERADTAVREVSAAMATQHTAALAAVKESHQKVVDNLLLQLDAARTDTVKVRSAAIAAEKALRQRITRLESASQPKARTSTRTTRA
jgi:chromosome segregation ATPase